MNFHEEIVPVIHSKNKQPIKHHLSAFGILNRNGLEIINDKDLAIIEEKQENKEPEFLDWSMPEERQGYIQSKAHDFF